MESKTNRTIIIGAGAAGLSAAAELLASGNEVIVLEARDRIGGRVHTVRDPHWELPLEFGAEFIHGRPSDTWNLVHQQSLHAYDVTNHHWMSRDGKPVKDSQAWAGSEKIMERLATIRGADISFTEFLTQHCQHDAAEARALAKAFIEGLDAADAAEVSAISLIASEADGEKFDADMPFRLFDGYDKLLGSFARSAEKSLHLSTVVQSINWSRGRVIVRTTGGRDFVGARLIVTVPIGVLLANQGDIGAMEFVPPLPPTMRHAIEHMRMGPVVKVLLRFRRAVWEEGPWRDLAFVHSPGNVFPTWWTMLPLRVPMLTAWAGGPAAAALSHQPAGRVIDQALATLSPLIDVDEATLRHELVAWHVSDWQADPFARGAYAYSRVGGAAAATQLATPVENTLFFAGEATHAGYAGTVAAAIESGKRAARQVVQMV